MGSCVAAGASSQQRRRVRSLLHTLSATMDAHNSVNWYSRRAPGPLRPSCCGEAHLWLLDDSMITSSVLSF